MSKALIITAIAIVVIAIGATAVYITQRQEGGKVKEQPAATPEVFTPELKELVKESLKVNMEGTKYYNKARLRYGKDRARQMTVEWLKKQSVVKDAGISIDGSIWMEFVYGGNAIILSK